MPCWPDLWHEFLRLWPDYVLIAFLGIIALMLWAPRVKWLWVRVVLRVVGGVAGLFALIFVGFGVLLIADNPKPEIRTVASPNGTHEAILKYQAGFLGRDFTRVTIRSKGCCEHFTAYEYAGPGWISSTTMTWLDDSHLRISYYSDPARYPRQHCVSRVADVSVDCIPMKWPTAR